MVSEDTPSCVFVGALATEGCRVGATAHHTGSMCLQDDFAKCKNCRHNLWTLHFIFTKKERILSPRQSYCRLKVEKLRHVVETSYFCSAGCSPPAG